MLPPSSSSKMLFVRFLSLVTTACVAYAVTVSPHVRHEHRRSIPDGWSLIRRADSNTLLPLRIGLVQPGLEDIEKHILDVSSPDSPNYGQHWSPAKIAATFRPSKDAVDTVRLWLASEGIDASRVKLTGAGNWVEAKVSVKEAESLLKTQYSVYEHGTTGTQHIACESAYHLPEHVSKHVDLVTPTLHFDAKLRGRTDEGLEKRAANPRPGFAKSIGQPGIGMSPKTNGRFRVSRVIRSHHVLRQLILFFIRVHTRISLSATSTLRLTVSVPCTTTILLHWATPGTATALVCD